MKDDDYISPTRTGVARCQHPSVGRGMDRITQFAIFSANPVGLVGLKSKVRLAGFVLPKLPGPGVLLLPEFRFLPTLAS